MRQLLLLQNPRLGEDGTIGSTLSWQGVLGAFASSLVTLTELSSPEINAEEKTHTETICGCINKGSVVNLRVLLVQEKSF